MTDKRPLKVFLCHASTDKPKVRELYRYLKKRGIQPWFDEEDLVGGQDWQVEIPKALATSDAIIICLTKNSVDKEGYIQKEIKYALDKALEMPEGRIFLIPVKFEECEVPFTLSRYQWVDLTIESGYAKMMKALKFRASQLERSTVEVSKKDVEEENLTRQKEEWEVKENAERETAEKIAREKAEREAAEKAAREKMELEFAKKSASEKAKREADERARKLAEEKIRKEKEEREKQAVKKEQSSQNRILEAAIEKQVSVGVSTSLFVWIKRLESKSIISVVSSIDEDVVLDEGNVKSKGLEIEFPIENGRVLPVGISLRLVAHEFTPSIQQKKIIVPPEGDSEVCTFIVTANKTGRLLLNLEVLRDQVSLVTRTLHTTAIESEKKEPSSMVLVSIPIIVFVQPKSDGISVGGDISGSVVVSGSGNVINFGEQEESVSNRPKPKHEKQKKSFKTPVPIIVALIGFLGTIVAGLLGSPLIEKWYSPVPTTILPITATNIAISSPIPTDTDQPGEPTSIVFPSEITDDKGVSMAFVPAGEFTMGSETSQEVVRQVYLVDFYMDIYEVTNAAYELCVDASGCSVPQATNSYTRPSYYGNSKYDNYPVVFVDWTQAKNYCEWRGADLPTEAQWEKAARGTDGRTYPWGEILDCRYANYSGCGSMDTMAVGSFDEGKSPFGIYDMAGNVFEIVDDWYSGTESYRIVRGGSWDSGSGSWIVENVNYVINIDTLKTFSRDIFRTNIMGGSNNVGFRCAKGVTP